MGGIFRNIVQKCRGNRRGIQAEPDEDVLEDAVAFAGVSQYPSRVKCALLGWMAFKDAVGRADAARSDNGAQRAEA